MRTQDTQNDIMHGDLIDLNVLSGTPESDTLVGTGSNDRICGFDGVHFIEDLGR